VWNVEDTDAALLPLCGAMTSEREERAKAYDDEIFELRQNITKWQLHMPTAGPVEAASLVEQISLANDRIAEIEAEKAVLLGEAP
jgi:hypothetical protein